MITPEQFKTKMQEIVDQFRDDTEGLHAHLDEFLMQTLRELGFGEGIDIYDGVDKWYA